MGLRHLPVVGKSNRLSGLITRDFPFLKEFLVAVLLVETPFTGIALPLLKVDQRGNPYCLGIYH